MVPDNVSSVVVSQLARAGATRRRDTTHKLQLLVSREIFHDTAGKAGVSNQRFSDGIFAGAELPLQ